MLAFLKRISISFKYLLRLIRFATIIRRRYVLTQDLPLLKKLTRNLLIEFNNYLSKSLLRMLLRHLSLSVSLSVRLLYSR